MKLHYSTTSPYVRKVMAVAIEAGVVDRIDKVPAPASPVGVNDTLNRDNPLGKVPCLVTEEGQALFDSRVICEYLDSLGGGRLFPASGAARWTALRRQAQADGLLDAALLARYETAMRPGDKLWQEWHDGQKAKIARALDAFEAEAGSFGDTLDIGTLATACALGYLDFRYAADRWRDGRPKLAAWFETFSKRPSIETTAAPEG